MFYITNKAGFHIKFANQYLVSVQFGPGNYCANHDMVIGSEEEEAGRLGSPTAEVAVIDTRETDRTKRLLALPEFEGDNVGGYYTAEMVLELMNKVAGWER